MRERLARRAGEEDGVVLVLVALLMVVILASCALAIDVGSFYTSQRHAQSAADAAALAAAQDYAQGTTDSTTLGQDITTFVHDNYPDGNAIAWTASYGGVAGRFRVEVAGDSPAFFGKALGVTSAKVDASAVAGASGNAGSSVVFAKDTNCGDPGVTINGNSLFTGNVHSNGSLTNGATSTTIGAASYGGPNGCAFTNNGHSSTIGGPTNDPNNEPWPYDYSTQPFPPVPACTTGPSAPNFNQPSFTWTSTMPTGTYCATGDITINGTGIDLSGDTFISTGGKILIQGTQVSGNASFYANGTDGSITLAQNNSTINGIFESTGKNGVIAVNGNSISGSATMIATALQFNSNSTQIAPYPGENGLVAYQTGTQPLTINGNGYLDGGTIFAPNAPIVFNSNGAGTISGFMEAQDVTINANNLTINGTGPNVNYGGVPALLQ